MLVANRTFKHYDTLGKDANRTFKHYDILGKEANRTFKNITILLVKKRLTLH